MAGLLDGSGLVYTLFSKNRGIIPLRRLHGRVLVRRTRLWLATTLAVQSLHIQTGSGSWVFRLVHLPLFSLSVLAGSWQTAWFSCSGKAELAALDNYGSTQHVTNRRGHVVIGMYGRVSM